MNQSQIEQSLPVGSKVLLNPRASQWYLENAHESFVRPSGTLDPEYDTVIQLMMCHQLGEDVNATVVKYGSFERRGEYGVDQDSLSILLNLEVGDWKYTHYFDSNDLTLADPLLAHLVDQSRCDQEIIKSQNDWVTDLKFTNGKAEGNAVFLRNELVQKDELISELQFEIQTTDLYVKGLNATIDNYLNSLVDAKNSIEAKSQTIAELDLKLNTALAELELQNKKNSTSFFKKLLGAK